MTQSIPVHRVAWRTGAVWTHDQIPCSSSCCLISEVLAAPGVVLRPAAQALPYCLLEMQTLGPWSRLCIRICVLTNSQVIGMRINGWDALLWMPWRAGSLSWSCGDWSHSLGETESLPTREPTRTVKWMPRGHSQSQTTHSLLGPKPIHSASVSRLPACCLNASTGVVLTTWLDSSNFRHSDCLKCLLHDIESNSTSFKLPLSVAS